MEIQFPNTKQKKSLNLKLRKVIALSEKRRSNSKKHWGKKDTIPKKGLTDENWRPFIEERKKKRRMFGGERFVSPKDSTLSAKCSKKVKARPMGKRRALDAGRGGKKGNATVSGRRSTKRFAGKQMRAP